MPLNLWANERGLKTAIRLFRQPAWYSAVSLGLLALVGSTATSATMVQEWPFYGGDQGEQHYSPLDQINRGNIRGLRPVWQWKPDEAKSAEYQTQPGAFEATPLMIGGVLYLSTPYNRVVALDAASGRQLWAYDPKAYTDGQPPNGNGFIHRGVAAWHDRRTGRLRIFFNSRYRLISLDAETGKPVNSFGDNGIVNLLPSLRWKTNPKQYTNTSPPVVYRDLVILGNGAADRLVYKKDPPGDVRAFDAHTGKLVWTFHTVPMAGELGWRTWAGGSEKYTGHTNVWAPMTLDDQRGLLYLPVSTPSNDFYGGSRLGENLFAESLVCLDAATGKRRWHFQLVHHGLWDYDLASPPVLTRIQVRGSPMDAVVQLTKMGWAFVFDRVTGKPIWPITERPVPASDVPGEKAWPTQPAPSKPPPFADQGVTLDDAFDLTPELKSEARAELRKYRLGPIYTPPSMQGTFIRPGTSGGANWGGGAFDQSTGILYVRSSNRPSFVRIKKVGTPVPGELEAVFVGDTGFPTFHGGLPLIRPPYGHITAIDLNRGEIVWKVPFGDQSMLRSLPALKNARLPGRLGDIGAAGAIVTKGGLIFCGDGEALRALDAADGRELWSYSLGRESTSTPMTYRTTDGHQFVVVATGRAREQALIAFALR